MKICERIIITIIVFSIFIVGCKKNNTETNNVIPPDIIVYTDIYPDTSFTSVNYWYNGWVFPLPVPPDSSAGMGLDLNKDGITDVWLNIRTIYEDVSASNPQANYNYSSEIAGNNSKDSVACESPYAPKAKIFQKDSLISGNSPFYDFGVTYGQGISTFNVTAPTGDSYYGFKLFKNGGYNFGWVLLNIDPIGKILTIKEYAINMSLNKPIKAGQIK
jgi:hypothetical protein